MRTKNILVTGGAGYIGSAVCLELLRNKHTLTIIDKQPLPDYFKKYPLTFFQQDFACESLLHTLFSTTSIDCVIHLAASIEVGRSVTHPDAFYENNVIKTALLIKIMRLYGVAQLIFSSSAAVYGTPQFLPISEDHPRNPISPYGRSKLMVELMLEDFAHAFQFNSISLRYFNAAGALPDYGIGEIHCPETHLIPLLLDSAYSGAPFSLFGSDYPTPDGTCLRDYIHIQDIARLHLAALSFLDDHQGAYFFNAGSGVPYSVKELIDILGKITRKPPHVISKQRRQGDPPGLIADVQSAAKLLNFTTEFSDIASIFTSAHDFYVQRYDHTLSAGPVEKNHGSSKLKHKLS